MIHKKNLQTAHEKEFMKDKQKKRMSMSPEQQDKVKTIRKLSVNGPN